MKKARIVISSLMVSPKILDFKNIRFITNLKVITLNKGIKWQWQVWKAKKLFFFQLSTSFTYFVPHVTCDLLISTKWTNWIGGDRDFIIVCLCVCEYVCVCLCFCAHKTEAEYLENGSRYTLWYNGASMGYS